MRALLVSVLLCAGSARAADVAVLKSTDVPAWRPTIEALRKAIAGHNMTEHDLRADKAEAERVIGGFKGKGTLLVALGPLAALTAHEVAPDNSLVFCMVQDPVKLGLVGAPNTTGVAFVTPVKNQFAAFRLVNPRGVRIGVIYSLENVGRQVQEAQKAASLVRVMIVDKAVASEREVPEALRSLLRGGQAVDALWLPPDPILLGDEARRHILSETLKAGKPVYTFSPALVAEGALVSDGPDFTSIGELAGEIVNRLAGGEKAAKIDMAIPRAELIINKKIADKLKIEIPAEALKIANKVL